MKPCAAIAGAGLMGFWHAKTIKRVGGSVAAVFDLNAAAAQSLAGKFPGARAGTSLDQLLTENKIDVLHICAPTASHYELATAALARGIHVLVEKPMTSTAVETERLYELAAKSRVQLCPVHQFPFQRGVEDARRALPSLGKLLHLTATFCSAGAAGKSESEMDSIVGDILPHPLSLMALFSPGSLDASDWTLLRPRSGELQSCLRHAGVTCSILISLNGRPTTTALTLLTTGGTIHLDLFHGFCVTETGEVSRMRKILHPFGLAARTFIAAGSNLARRAYSEELAYPGLRTLITSFYRTIRMGGSPPILPEEVCKVARRRDEILRNGGLAPINE